MKTYTINIGKDLHDLITEIARERKLSRAAVVRLALERQRKKREKAKAKAAQPQEVQP
jgi:predicted transcriptional regulator